MKLSPHNQQALDTAIIMALLGNTDLANIFRCQEYPAFGDKRPDGTNYSRLAIEALLNEREEYISRYTPAKGHHTEAKRPIKKQK